MKSQLFLFAALFFCFIFTGCIPSSRYVDENSRLIKVNAKTIVLMAKQIDKTGGTDETKALFAAAKKDFREALEHSEKSSALVNKELIAAAVKKVAGKAAGVLGLPTGVGEGIGGFLITALLGLFGLERGKRKRAVKLGHQAAGENPDLGKKIMSTL